MAIEVRIPTILRTYTGGEKAVTGDGTSLSSLLVAPLDAGLLEELAVLLLRHPLTALLDDRTHVLLPTSWSHDGGRW